MRIIGSPKDAQALMENERRAIEKRNKLKYERMAEPSPSVDTGAQRPEGEEKKEEKTKVSKSKRSKKKV